ncbi:alpha/beta hydrolase family protein [Silvimonas iriomotensis]|uniref:Dienelactone hydrolase n=1 Tax=Silvimonas iriomotensis TaxID=449662 RepID=A0ABQ2P8P3_9NEIS|nr:dienelactone hydrolase [Silvimonas iriomotensis]GGP21086.1 dienelactone hydrolase [Silvimonas iriomotensis]
MKSVRHGLLAGLLVISSLCAHAAGFAWISVPADAEGPALKGAVWYPSATAPTALALGPFTLNVAKDAPVQGDQLPLVVMSHGTGGSALGHLDTAMTLAEAGFVVAAINHPGDNFEDLSQQMHVAPFYARPRDISRLISWMTRNWPQASHINPQAIGFFGFSRGGYTGLVSIGAVPDLKQGAAFCVHQPDLPFCTEIKGPLPPWPPADTRIKAAVIVDPLSVFNAAGLAQITVPVQLWASAYGGDGVTPESVAAIRAALPHAPEFYSVAGAGHFSFLAPCPAQMAAARPGLCNDRPGFDRVAFHQHFNAQVTTFFQSHLAAPAAH